MLNARKHSRAYLQHFARGGILHAKLTEFTPRLNMKPVIKDISFGGMGLILFSPLGNQTIELLQSGKSNLFLEFTLPSTMKMLGVTGKMKWMRKKNYLQTPYTSLGIEFTEKTQELYREIDRFFKMSTTQSEVNPNRRFFPRIPVKLKMEYTVTGLKKWGLIQKVFQGDILNLSAQGLSLRTITPLTAKDYECIRTAPQNIKLRFYMDFANRFFNANARAVYINKSKDSQSLIMGIKFIDLSEQDVSMLVEYLSVKRHTFIKEDISLLEKPPSLEKIAV
jgi:c-di-GMP-binding flagellar brake protein YcgR